MASHLSPDQRRRIRTLRYDAGLSYGRIVTITGATKRAVQSICTTPSTPKKAPGRLRILTAPLRCELQAIIENDTQARRMTYDELSAKLQLSASARTMRRTMQDLGYIRAIARAKPFLNDTAKAKRLAWAINHKPYGTEDWNRVIWTDESAMQNGGPKNVWVTRQPGKEEAYREECLQPVFRKLDQCMIWGAIAVGHKSPLVIWDKQRGNMTALGYQEHILPVLHDFKLQVQQAHDEPVIIMQDNAPIHKAKSTMQWLSLHDLIMMDWPASSPDLNPIENIWAIIKYRVRQRMNGGPHTHAALVEAVQAEWDALEQDEIDRVIFSMERRVDALLLARGGPVRW